MPSPPILLNLMYSTRIRLGVTPLIIFSVTRVKILRRRKPNHLVRCTEFLHLNYLFITLLFLRFTARREFRTRLKLVMIILQDVLLREQKATLIRFRPHCSYYPSRPPVLLFLSSSAPFTLSLFFSCLLCHCLPLSLEMPILAVCFHCFLLQAMVFQALEVPKKSARVPAP